MNLTLSDNSSGSDWISGSEDEREDDAFVSKMQTKLRNANKSTNICCKLCNKTKPSTSNSKNQLKKPSRKCKECCQNTTQPTPKHQQRHTKQVNQMQILLNHQTKTMPSTSNINVNHLIDIGINLTNKQFRKNWKYVVQQAINVGVNHMILTGTSISSSIKSLEMATEWFRTSSNKNLLVTIGIHPHDASTFILKDNQTISKMRALLNNPLAICVGECGLDYNRNFSTPKDQQIAFREQIQLAIELNKPLFVHEREAHNDLIKILQTFDSATLPPIVIHCFTGTATEAQTYIKLGYYIGFTGTICKKERGLHLRALLKDIPLDRILLETDAPFMGFVKGRRNSVPADVLGVAQCVADTKGIALEVVCQQTTRNSVTFFGLDSVDTIEIKKTATQETKEDVAVSKTMNQSSFATSSSQERKTAISKLVPTPQTKSGRSNRTVPTSSSTTTTTTSSVSSPRHIFISCSRLSQCWKSVPADVLKTSLFLFGSKYSWLFPSSVEEKKEAQKQPGKYHLMDDEFKQLIQSKWLLGEVHFLKKEELKYVQYPGPPDEEAYTRVSDWLVNVHHLPKLQLGLEFWNDVFGQKSMKQFKYCKSKKRILKNIATGRHEYDELCELLIQSCGDLIVPLVSKLKW